MSAGVFAASVIAIFAVVAAVWWYTAVDTSPAVPNTGATTTVGSSSPATGSSIRVID